MPADVPLALAAGLAETKEALRRGWLQVLLAVCRGAPALVSSLGAVAGPVGKILSDAQAKAVLRGEGLMALMVAAQLAAADDAAGGRPRGVVGVVVGGVGVAVGGRGGG